MYKCAFQCKDGILLVDSKWCKLNRITRLGFLSVGRSFFPIFKCLARATMYRSLSTLCGVCQTFRQIQVYSISVWLPFKAQSIIWFKEWNIASTYHNPILYKWISLRFWENIGDLWLVWIPKLIKFKLKLRKSGPNQRFWWLSS